MEKQEIILKSDLNRVVYKSVFGVIQLVDITIFKIVLDYIVRNFDPTGINIGGLIDSFCYVFIKPELLLFYKRFKGGISRYRELTIKSLKLPPGPNLHATKVLCYWHGYLKH